MGERLTRRDALRKLGATGFSVGLIGLGGLDRLARAVADEVNGPAEPLYVTGGCPEYGQSGVITWYGCHLYFALPECSKTPPDYCGNEHNCPQLPFDCPQGTTVGCWSPNARHNFTCKADEDGPYQCNIVTFHCQNGQANAVFECGDSTVEGHDPEFFCNTRDERFECNGHIYRSESFICRTHSPQIDEYHCNSERTYQC